MDHNTKEYSEGCSQGYLVTYVNFVTLLPACVLVFFLRIPGSNILYTKHLTLSLHIWHFLCLALNFLLANTSAYAHSYAASPFLHKNAHIGGLCSYLYSHFTSIFSPFPFKLSLWLLMSRLQVRCVDRLLFSHLSWANNHCFSSWPLPAAIKLQNHFVPHCDWILTFTAVPGRELGIAICGVSHRCAEPVC